MKFYRILKNIWAVQWATRNYFWHVTFHTPLQVRRSSIQALLERRHIPSEFEIPKSQIDAGAESLARRMYPGLEISEYTRDHLRIYAEDVLRASIEGVYR